MMKKITYFATALALLTTVSCMNEKMETSAPEAGNSDNYVEFTAEIPSTKTSLSNDGTNNVLWNPGDKISVYDATTKKGVDFTTDITENTASATFKGSAAPFNGVMFFAAQGFSVQWSSFNQPRFNILPFQNAVKDTYDPRTVIAVAKTTATEKQLHFKNLNAFIKFTVVEGGEKFNIVKVKSFQDKKFVNGSMKYNIALNEMTKEPNPSLKDITLSRNDKANLEPGTYYISVMPNYYDMGLEFNFTNADNDMNARKIISNAKNIEPGKIYNLGTFKDLLWQ